MTHYRQKMREWIVARLKAIDLKGVNDRVFGTIFFASRELPLVTVWIEGESVQPEAGQYERRIAVNITLFVKAVADVENDADAFCAQIEANLDKKLGGLALDGWLSEVRFERKGDGEQEYISAELAYVFRYVTGFYDPTIST